MRANPYRRWNQARAAKAQGRDPAWSASSWTLYLLLALLIALPSPSRADDVPKLWLREGRVMTPAGAPVVGAVELTFAIYATAQGGVPLWQERHQVTLDDAGAYSVQLGSHVEFPVGVWALGARFLGIRVGGDTEMAPRTLITSAPYALRAAVADNVTGDIEPRSIKVAGKTIVDAEGRIPAVQALVRSGSGNGTVLDLEFEQDEHGFLGDSSGREHVAYPSGPFYAQATGHSGLGLNLSGGSLVVPAEAAADVPDSPQIWVEAWIYPQLPSEGLQLLVGKPGVFELTFVPTSTTTGILGNVRFGALLRDGTRCDVAALQAPMPLHGDWHHVAGWFDGLRATVAIDGRYRNTVTCQNAPLNSVRDAPVYVGGVPNTTLGGRASSAFIGRMDEIRIRQVASQTYSSGRTTYYQWGRNTCTGLDSQTLYGGFAFANHINHGGNGEAMCLSPGQPLGEARRHTGDTLYGVGVGGGANVHPGRIVENSKLQCALCATNANMCFRMDGATSCPAGFHVQYSGYLYGGYQTHGRQARLCLDDRLYDGSVTNAGSDNGSWVYPTSTEGVAGTGVPGASYIRCAVCCAD